LKKKEEGPGLNTSLAALIDLVHEEGEHGGCDNSGVDRGNQPRDPLVALLLIRLKDILELQFPVEVYGRKKLVRRRARKKICKGVEPLIAAMAWGSLMP